MFWFHAEHLTFLSFNITYTVAFHQVVSLNFCAVSKAIMPGKTVSECVRKLILQKTREKYSQRQISKKNIRTTSNHFQYYFALSKGGYAVAFAETRKDAQNKPKIGKIWQSDRTNMHKAV